MAEDHRLDAKQICEVISNNKCYYKEIFDYWHFAKGKIVALYRHNNPKYVSWSDSGAMFNSLLGAFGGKK